MRPSGARHILFFLAVLTVAMPPRVGGAQSPAAGGRVTRSRAEVESLIAKVGKTPPDWWDSTPLTYPPTLDLNWPMRAGGPWDARKNVGQYIWDVINPNPGRWKEGIKLVNHLMIRHQKDQEKLVRAMETLGQMYHNLMEDWARAAFWWRLCDQRGGYVDWIGLAHCYWKLGSKEMAAELLTEIGSDETRHGAVIKLWADMGEFDKALSLAQRKAADGMPAIAYLAAGDACRLAGRYGDALTYYRRALAAREDAGREGDVKKARERAQASIEAIQLFDLLDVAQVADGVYKASSIAYAGPLHVEVTVKGGRIESVRVTRHEEKQFYSALTDTPAQIVQKQGVRGVDAVTGATMTSEAILNATARALAQGMREKATK